MWTKTWRYKIPNDFNYKSYLLLGVSFSNEWVKIENGEIVIKAGYAWDGCSPAYKVISGKLFPSGIWFGPWDGPIGIDGHVVSHRASLVHDALCQFREDITGLTKDLVVEIFKQLLEKDSAPLWMTSIYPKMVSMFGPQKWK